MTVDVDVKSGRPLLEGRLAWVQGTRGGEDTLEGWWGGTARGERHSDGNQGGEVLSRDVNETLRGYDPTRTTLMAYSTRMRKRRITPSFLHARYCVQ